MVQFLRYYVKVDISADIRLKICIVGAIGIM